MKGSNKRAIAPLIATVILVGFAVSLAALVIDWNVGFYESTVEKTDIESSTRVDCTVDIDFGISSIRGISQICYNNDTENIEMTIENSMPDPIDQVLVRVITNETVIGPSELHTLSGGNVTQIIGGGAIKGVMNVSAEQEIEEVTIIPGLKIGDNTRLCANSMISVAGPLNDCRLI